MLAPSIRWLSMVLIAVAIEEFAEGTGGYNSIDVDNEHPASTTRHRNQEDDSSVSSSDESGSGESNSNCEGRSGRITKLAAGDLVYLLENPLEAVILPKKQGTLVFDVPEDMLAPRYQGMPRPCSAAGNQEVVKVSKLKEFPDLTTAKRIRRDEVFSVFNPRHRSSMNSLITILLDAKELDELLSIAAYVRDVVNPILFNCCFSIALMHRKDTLGIRIPTFFSAFPDHFLPHSVITQMKDVESFERYRRQAEDQRTVIDVPFPAPDPDDPETLLSYYREDIAMNQHHWQWHVIYPTTHPKMVQKDRRGELFFHLHHQILGRYNFERVSNGLDLVQPLDMEEEIVEGYIPTLHSDTAGKRWSSRGKNRKLQFVNRTSDDIVLSIEDMITWQKRILESIDSGFLYKEDKNKSLSGEDGIDLLGNVVESSILSYNKEYYGDLHNNGHTALAYIEDPTGVQPDVMGVVGTIETSARDPVFYRWHKLMDNIFMEHKRHFEPYHKKKHLEFPGVVAKSVEVNSVDSTEPNTFITFWQHKEVELAYGTDFKKSQHVYVRYQHLQHKNFTYTIQVENNGKRDKKGTVRVFLAPKYLKGHVKPGFNVQKDLLIQMDRFAVHRKAHTITRLSNQSSVINYNWDTFSTLVDQKSQPENMTFYPGCGWPPHLLVPRGSEEGLECELVVMVSDRSVDKVREVQGSCMCGVPNSDYPDRRPLSYPFDRWGDESATLSDFLTPNMIVQDVKIKFLNKIIDPGTK